MSKTAHLRYVFYSVKLQLYRNSFDNLSSSCALRWRCLKQRGVHVTGSGSRGPWPAGRHMSSWRRQATSLCWVCRRWGCPLQRIRRPEIASSLWSTRKTQKWSSIIKMQRNGTKVNNDKNLCFTLSCNVFLDFSRKNIYGGGGGQGKIINSSSWQNTNESCHVTRTNSTLIGSTWGCTCTHNNMNVGQQMHTVRQ